MAHIRKRIGIYAGSFDPVHVGHITFALQSLQAANLDEVYFMPERRPRGKPGVVHFAHRIGMINKAVQPYAQLKSLEMVDISFSIERTLPRLIERFHGDKLVFLFGSDAFLAVPTWPHAATLIGQAELTVGVRSDQEIETVKVAVERLPVQSPAVTIFKSYAPAISSTHVREALYKGELAPGTLPSVARYSNRHWVYTSVS